jgi:hypothetical protein
MLTPEWLQRVVNVTLAYERRWGSASLPNYMLALHLTGSPETTPDAVAARMQWSYSTARRHLEAALCNGYLAARTAKGAKLYRLAEAEASWISGQLCSIDPSLTPKLA